MNKQGMLKRFLLALTAAILMVSMAIPMAFAAPSDTITVVWYPNESAAD